MYANRLLHKRKDNTINTSKQLPQPLLYCAVYIIMVLLMFDLMFKFGQFSLKTGINHCFAASVQTARVWVPFCQKLQS